MTSRDSTPLEIVGWPTEADIRWLCLHPNHSLVMVEINGVYVPMILDGDGQGPVTFGPEETW